MFIVIVLDERRHPAALRVHREAAFKVEETGGFRKTQGGSGLRIFFDWKSIPAQIQHLTHLPQAKEEEVKRKQREVEAAMRILDRSVDQ